MNLIHRKQSALRIYRISLSYLTADILTRAFYIYLIKISVLPEVPKGLRKQRQVGDEIVDC
jgi:hypothetical protein